MLSGCIIYSHKCTLLRLGAREAYLYIHRRGAFDVARFDWMGNARALMRGTSDRVQFPTLFLLLIFSGGEQGKKE